MPTIPEIFRANADSFGATMNRSSGTVSFKLPEYQRPYDWSSTNVLRLLRDCLNGLKRTASQSSDSHHTFLGTTILVDDHERESTFPAESLLIVDGQQRLTTLLLLCCAMYSAIKRHETDIEQVSDDGSKNWLRSEVQEQLDRLYRCIISVRTGVNEPSRYPRMVRFGDIRAHSPVDYKYDSGIANFLKQFQDYCAGQLQDFQPTIENPEKHLQETYEYIQKRVERYVYLGEGHPEDQDDEFDPPSISMTDFSESGCRQLFATLQSMGQQSNSIVDSIASEEASEQFIRLLLFSSYVMQSVVLAVVEAPNEEIAFEIFDALNTTGEPLTALETLKPHVVKFETEQFGRFSGSESEQWWRILEEDFLDTFRTPNTRQQHSKELVTEFALFYVGQNIGADLNTQRNTLRNYFTEALQQEPNVPRQIVRSLARLAHYRQNYWNTNAINALVMQQDALQDYIILKFCLRFLADTRTSLVNPILARYWDMYGEMDAEKHFLNAVKAVTSFLVIRRAATGGTARIDSDFRKVMSLSGRNGADPLCLGTEMSNEIVDLEELKFQLQSLLAARRLNIRDKESWLRRATQISLANLTSRAVYRFLLFAASHSARPDEARPGMLTREGAVSGQKSNFLNFEMWVGPLYSTIEHVAPDSEGSAGWDASIYHTLNTHHKIGNLVLLPEKENDSIGNAPWTKKKLFYRALMADTVELRDEASTLAAAEGLQFGPRATSLISNQESLFMLESLRDVEHWTVELINERTENVLSLAWDAISPWLYD